MSKYIKKDENGFYVFDEIEFSKTLPTGLEYFAVDKETEQIYNLGFNYKEKMENQIADLEAKLAERKEFCISQTQSLLDINNALIQENNELKQQLAEKDDEIGTLKEQFDIFTIKNAFKYQHCNEEPKYIAIKQLEKLKEFCDGMKWAMVHLTKENTQTIQTVLDEIDNQINVLRNNKDGIH